MSPIARGVRRQAPAGAADQPSAEAGAMDRRVSAFLRGLTVGALVGAAIAGSALWERAQRRRDGERAAEAVDGAPGAPPVEPGRTEA